MATKKKFDDLDIGGFDTEKGQVEPESPSKAEDQGAVAHQAKVDLLSVADDDARAHTHNDDMKVVKLVPSRARSKRRLPFLASDR